MTTIGRYELRGELGQGGMATVYRAYDAMLNREVALKVMAAHLTQDPSFYRRFEREAKAIATLEHPNIVPVYDYGLTENGQPYLVMRMLRGTLYDRLAAGSMTRQQLLSALAQVASALDYAHGRQVVHRDMKSVNILFDEKANAYVSDFGIAKVVDATTNLTGNAFMGTPAYMSPEQFTGGTLDGRSDQYSLAVVAFEALSGRVPFAAETIHGLMYQHVHEPPPDIHTIDKSLPPGVSATLRRALAKRPEDRFATVSDFIEALRLTATPGAAAAQTQQLQSYYDSGRYAYEHDDWPAAADFLGRVVAADAGYRDANQLYKTAVMRTQAGAPPAVAAPQPPIVREAGSPVAAPAPAGKSRLPLLLGLLALLIIGGAAAFFFLRPDAAPEATPVAVVAPTEVATEAPTATPAPTDTPLPTELPPIAGAARVVEAGAASYRVDGGSAQPLPNDTALPLELNRTVNVAVGEGRLQLVLPDGTRLYLDEGAEISLTADRAGVPFVTVEEGRVLAWSHTDGLQLTSALDGRATLLGSGVMGVNMLPGRLSFEVACLEGSCDVSGAEDTAALRLRNGQQSVIGGDGFAAPPSRLDRAAYVALAPDVLGEANVVAETAVTEEATPAPTETAAPTETPTAAPTDTPAPTARPTTSGSGPQNTTPLGPGALDFEAFGNWVRGDQDNGTFTRSTAQTHGGAASAELAYDFGTAGNDFVVFQQEHAISGEPNVLRLWVYGDGSGHYLNAWIIDANNQTWQVPFGRVTHTGWKQMEARIDVDQDWPWTQISGPDNGQVDYPIRFRAFVLDDLSNDYVGKGKIYLDDLTVGTGVAGAQPTTAPGATVPPGATTAPGATVSPDATATAPTGQVGAILFTAAGTLYTVDPGGTPISLGPATADTCSATASAGGVSYDLAPLGSGCAVIGDGLSLCASPNGAYEVLVSPAPAGTTDRPISIRPAGSAESNFIVQTGLNGGQGIAWSPNSSSFLFTSGGDIVQGFANGSYQTIVRGQPALQCPRWVR